MAVETWNKHEIDMARFAEQVLGPPDQRRGSTLKWLCPLHNERTASFTVTAGRPTWRCWGCGEHGDAADLIGRLEGLPFLEAARRADEIAGAGMRYDTGDTTHKAHIKPAPKVEEDHSLTRDEATAIVLEGQERLWSSKGADALEYLRSERGLTDDTIHNARLGWTPRSIARKKDDGEPYPFSGLLVPWLDGDRLEMVKVRQFTGRAKYLTVFKSEPEVYPSVETIAAGRPLVIVEGEFDNLLMGQQLPEVSVVTFGSASGSASRRVLMAMLVAGRRFLATDSDEAGESVAAKFPGQFTRVKPLGDCKDWTDLHQTGFSRVRNQWQPILNGPAVWEELSHQTWGPIAEYEDDKPQPVEWLAEFNQRIGRTDPINV